jgi:hypothetical protein
MAFLGSRRVLRASMIPLVLDMDAIVYPLALVLPLFVHYCLAWQIELFSATGMELK